MKRFIWMTFATIVALAAVGIPLAVSGGDKATKTVSATFAAPTVGEHRTTTCTAADGTFQVAKGVYTGTATGSDPVLSGPVTIRVHSVINTTKSLGWVEGELAFGPPSETTAHFVAVYANGKISGQLRGHVSDPQATLLGNFSATFSPDAGFSGGSVGSAAGVDTALLLNRGDCKTSEREHGDRTKTTTEVKGSVTALSASSITIQPEAGQVLTCAVSSKLAAQIADLHVMAGDRVGATCSLENGALSLQRIRKVEQAPRRTTEAKGTISALSVDSITVKTDGGETLTCGISTQMAVQLALLHLAGGDTVSVACQSTDGKQFLVRIKSVQKAEIRSNVEAKGTLSALSANSLTVTKENGETLTCSFGSQTAAELSSRHFATGDKVAVHCKRSAGSYALFSITRT